MQYSRRDPKDIPVPPTPDELAQNFGLPVVGFIEQPALTEVGAGSMSTSSNGGPMEMRSVSLSYTLWRNPADHDDPINLAEMTDEMRRSLDVEPVRELPDWMMKRRALMRYPTLWEVVTTTRFHPDEAPLETALVSHVNHILMNNFRDQRVVGGFPGELDAPVDERHIEARTILVDGVARDGIQIDTDAHVYGSAVFLGDRIVTAVIPRDLLSYINPAFATRQTR